MGFLNHLISGISLGSIYAIIALQLHDGLRHCENAELRARRCYHGRRLHSASALPPISAGRRGWALCWLLLSAPRSVLLLRETRLQAAAYGAVAGGADHGHRRFVLSAECGAADRSSQPEDLYLVVVTGRALSLFGGQDADLQGDARCHRSLHCHHGRSDAVHRQEQKGPATMRAVYRGQRARPS